MEWGDRLDVEKEGLETNLDYLEVVSIDWDF